VRLAAPPLLEVCAPPELEVCAPPPELVTVEPPPLPDVVPPPDDAPVDVARKGRIFIDTLTETILVISDGIMKSKV
jgi:hypothetical protein